MCCSRVDQGYLSTHTTTQRFTQYPWESSDKARVSESQQHTTTQTFTQYPHWESSDRVRVSVSQQHTTTQRFTQYPHQCPSSTNPKIYRVPPFGI